MSYTLEMHESVKVFDKAIERMYTLERWIQGGSH